MRNTIEFLTSVGKLKAIKRKGWVLRGIKNPETIAAHTFRMTIMAWVLCCGKKMNMNKILKMSLIHDLCEVRAGDTTPYDRILPKDEKKRKEMLESWPRLSQAKKEKIFKDKYKKEDKALKKIIDQLPLELKQEINNLWNDYEKGLTREGRFVRQVDRVENLLQAVEYWKEDKSFAIEPWWIQIEELIDDPILVEFIAELEKKLPKK